MTELSHLSMTIRHHVLQQHQQVELSSVVLYQVYRGRGLYAADLGGSSDPFTVLELDNTRLATHTEYKTLDPAWHKVFTLQVKVSLPLSRWDRSGMGEGLAWSPKLGGDQQSWQCSEQTMKGNVS